MSRFCELQRSTVRRGLLGGLVFGLAASSNAHDIYIWPSFFTVSMDKPWGVPVDVTASHTTFRPDFAMGSDGLEIYGVDGEEIQRFGAYFEGDRRSTFDLPVEAEGTYGLKYRTGPRYFTSYVIGRSKEPKFLRGDKQAAAAEVPSKAKDVETTAYLSVGMAYVTNNAPSDAVLKPTGSGFELVPVTHPADYVTGEEIVMSLMRDGEPVNGQDVVIELEGPQYRDQPVVFELKSDDSGEVAFTPEHGGRYMTKVLAEREVDSPLTDIEVTRVYYAFEVIYE
ncbi:MAG: DUF4198 domain-containing protein [Pseudomonadota bacterium]